MGWDGWDAVISVSNNNKFKNVGAPGSFSSSRRSRSLSLSHLLSHSSLLSPSPLPLTTLHDHTRPSSSFSLSPLPPLFFPKFFF